MKTKKQLIGKKSRAAGLRFQSKVREDLESKGWICDKWTNNVEFGHTATHDGSFIAVKWKDLTLKNGDHYPGPVARLVKAKAKWAGVGRPMMLGAGFPDFIAFQNHVNEKREAVFGIINECAPLGNDSKLRLSSIIGVESKMDGKLDKEEKEKCRWLIQNNIFSKILVARKGTKRGQIVYEEFK